ncbi:MAG TPA: beta-ketoacyl synthase chain length factor [Nitrospiraceae bacterium]|nr:beta-ketoacyl synthase chain length factor [Nitrospiraceae bacterium]
MECYVQAVGVLGPGLEGWTATRSILRGEEPYRLRPTSQPIPDILPATERRRSSDAARLAVAVAQEALRGADVPADDVATVFASSDGDGEITHKICESLAGPARDVSPTMFHNSVYNAPAGYWSIATGSRASSTSLCAYDVSFAAGLLEAAAQVAVERRAVLLVASDIPFPAPLHAVRPVIHRFAVALLLIPEATASGPMRWNITLEPRRVATSPPPGIEESLHDNPAAQCLPLLAALAGGGSETVCLDYLDSLSLIVSCGD